MLQRYICLTYRTVALDQVHVLRTIFHVKTSHFLKMRKELAEHPIEKVGKKLRDLMPWIGKNKLVDKSKN